jgi:hypothetical protein
MMTTLVAAKRTAALAVLLACALSAGCASNPAAEAKASQAGAEAAADVAVPPKQLLADVRRVAESPPLSLGVESEDRGTLVTGWKRFRGDWHIGRHWQERTRYRIEVTPDWEDPTGRARLRVTAETEQRATEGQRWDRETRVPRPKRAQDTLRQILEQLPKA